MKKKSAYYIYSVYFCFNTINTRLQVYFLNFKEDTVLFDYSDYIYLKISASPIAACSQSKYHQRSLKCFPV